MHLALVVSRPFRMHAAANEVCAADEQNILVTFENEIASLESVQQNRHQEFGHLFLGVVCVTSWWKCSAVSVDHQLPFGQR